MHIWLIGAGIMSLDYAPVLKELASKITVIGRGSASAQCFEKKTELPVVRGGLEAFLDESPELPDAAVVSVGVDVLAETTLSLISYGVKRILVEKPAGTTLQEIQMLRQEAQAHGAEIVLGYNRRFYASVQKAKELIEQDGGATSFTFEFTEWSHVISTLEKPEAVFNTWVIGNSTHVIDLAFYLGGEPEQISIFSAGSLDWHPAAARFTGAGMTDAGVPFSYHADWGAPGRWWVEILTAKNRYIFRPLEQLHVQKLGSVAIEKVEIDDAIDLQFKPGLYKQVESFLAGASDDICTIEDQERLFPIYQKIASYDNI